MLEETPLVSIAMATYNGEKYLAEQLDSLVNQTYPSIEIVITDDHSKDSTVSIIQSYQKRYTFIRLFAKEQNSGVTGSFENSVIESKGDFIAFCDQDDIWDLDKVSILVNEINQEDAVYSNSILVNKKGELLHRDFKTMMNLQSYYSGAPFLLANCVPGHTILMKTGFAKKILPFPRHIYFDNWISFCAAANNGIRYIDKGLVKYRQHEDNTIGVAKLRGKKKRETSQQLFNYKLKELEAFAKAPISSEETKHILHDMISLFHRGWNLKRSIFFFRNIDKILVIKNKPYYKKLFFCIKMFFKPNY